MNSCFSSLNLKANLSSLLKRALLSLASEINVDPSSLRKAEERISTLDLESIREESFGDYACTAAMEKSFRKNYAQKNTEFHNPRNFALAICAQLKRDKEAQRMLENVKVAGPGFINLTLRSSVLGEYMIQIRKKGEKLLLLPREKRKKIIFEYVSANPTGPLNVVSARAASLGDACAQLCKTVGHEVTREYYVNDHGNQITLLGQSLFLRYLESKGCLIKYAKQTSPTSTSTSDGEFLYPETPGIVFPKEAYHGEYLKETVQDLLKRGAFSILMKDKTDKLEELKILSQNKTLDSSFMDTEEMRGLTQKLGQKAVSLLLKEQKQSLTNFRVSFDNYFYESSLHAKGKLFEIQEKLEEQGLCYRENGAVFFRSTQYGDDKDRVLVRKDGRPSYFLADITYHANKIERGFEKIYNIWGPDHHGYILRMAGALKALGYEGFFKVLIAQQLSLLEAGKALPMSKRSGRTFSLRELIQEVPIDVVRYFFVMHSFESPMAFDLALAKDNSEKNPYYYVAYAYARICSIFRRAREKKLAPLKNQELKRVFSSGKTSLLKEKPSSQLWEWTPQRRRLVLQTVRFTEEMQAAAETLEPHRLANYLYSLATFLSQFYAPKENRIIQQEPRLAACLLAVLELVAFCLKKGLNLLGTEAPERLLRESKERDGENEAKAL